MLSVRYSWRAAAALVSSFFLASCAGSQPHRVTVLKPDANPNGAEMGRPLFECGYRHFDGSTYEYGHVLDDRGRIWFYYFDGRWSPEPAADGLFLESALRARFRSPVLQSLPVPAARLATMTQKAELAPAGRIDRKSNGNDKGASGCEAYLWEKADAYQRVELGSGGDFVVRNSSPEAGELKAWLQAELGMGHRVKLTRRH